MYSACKIPLLTYEPPNLPICKRGVLELKSVRTNMCTVVPERLIAIDVAVAGISFIGTL